VRYWAFFAVLAATSLATSSAHAQGFFGPFGYGYGYGYGVFMHDRMPQYSMFPPVYYSRPVPRPYGYSPFAYPPGVLTPPMGAVSRSPVIIVNPYAPAIKPSQSTDAKPEPLVIHNPYVRDEKLTAKAEP
jgi:hypothetical protein